MKGHVGSCIAEGCGLPLIARRAWQDGYRPDGHAPHGGSRLCRPHYHLHLKYGSTQAPPRQVVSTRSAIRKREELLEEYDMIRDDCTNVRQAAERLGMKFSTLDRALYRARLDGDRRAMPPFNQTVRAIARGNPYRIAA